MREMCNKEKTALKRFVASFCAEIIVDILRDIHNYNPSNN